MSLQPAVDDTPAALNIWSLTDRHHVTAMRAALGLDQPTRDEPCQPCAQSTRVVFEDPQGIHLAEVQLDCSSGPSTSTDAVAERDSDSVHVRLGAHPLCGRVALRDGDALAKLITRAQSQGKGRVPVALP